MQRPGMSHDTHTHDSAMQAFEKAAEAEADEARQEIIESFDRMAAHCKQWLIANGEPLESGPVPDMSDINLVDHTRGVVLPTNVPANVEDLQSLNDVYAAEGNLLNNTQRALLDYHLRFGKDPEKPASTPVAEVVRTMQAFAAKVRGETDELTRKTYDVYSSGPPETHRVLPTSDDEDLLELWAKKRGAPNEAEMYMLAKYIGVDVYDIYDWFKAKHLQTQAINLVLGEAFSHSKKSREIGVLRFRAAQVQTAWRRKLARMREQRDKAKREKERHQEPEGVSDGEAGKSKGKTPWKITMMDVRGEMTPFIDRNMD